MLTCWMTEKWEITMIKVKAKHELYENKSYVSVTKSYWLRNLFTRANKIYVYKTFYNYVIRIWMFRV